MSGNSPAPSLRGRAGPHATIAGPEYLAALSRFISTHEASLAAYYAPRRRQVSNGAPNTTGGPSWGTILTLGILPSASESNPSSTLPTSRPPTPGGDALVLNFDPHHLYYVLLKFDELGLPTGDALDTKVQGGKPHTRPMMVDRSAASTAIGSLEVINEGSSRTPSLLGGMFGFSGTSAKRPDDSRSVMSGKSSFSFGSGWWGLGGGNSASNGNAEDEPTLVRHVYSSCTKLPALKLSPFVFTPASPSVTSSSTRRSQPPSEAVEGFEDCPPPSTCVPLSLFHSLTSLYLQDLDPRAFVGWDKLSIQLRKLEVVRGGIEDVGELICDCVVEDEERTKRKRNQETFAEETVGHARKKRSDAEQSTQSLDHDDARAATEDSYPKPSKLAWSSLRHLSLHDNSLTFLPTPPMSHLSLLTSLDLSSNLLISVPPALSSLPCLRSLNLRDNMIDNLHSLATILGAVEVLNLSQNRLENLSGLDRLLALERLDLRGNRVWEALEVSRLSRLPKLRELWIKENPFSRDVVEGGEENWKVKCFAYFKEERGGYDDEGVEAEGGTIRIDGKLIEGRTERKLVDLEVTKRSGGAFLPGKTMRRRASTGIAGSREREESTNGGAAPPKKIVVEPRRRVVTAPLAGRRRQASATTDTTSPGPSLSSSPINASALSSPPPPLPQLKLQGGAVGAKRRKPRRIVDLDGPLPSSATGAAASGSHQLSEESDVTTTSSGAETGGIQSHAVPALATVHEPPAGPSTPSKRQQPKFASSPSRIGVSPNAFPTSSSPTNSRISGSSRKERVSASTYDAPEMISSSSGGGGGDGGGVEHSTREGGGEALRRKIEKLREEVGENWLSVLGEREARALQQQQHERQELEKQNRKGLEGDQEDRADPAKAEAAARADREEPSVEGLTVSAGVKVVKKKGKKKKSKGK
ncbi:hypothetical protein JCM3766R1_003866 [Sporobolomyces carnicolor]